MAKVKTRARPDIIVSSLDTWRIYKLLDAMPSDSFAGRDELLDELARGRMVGPTAIPPNVVTMNCVLKVTVSSPRKKSLELTLVYPENADEKHNKISIFTPLGSALIGLSEGDEIEWPKPRGGLMKVNVDAIVFQPEREGLYQI